MDLYLADAEGRDQILEDAKRVLGTLSAEDAEAMRASIHFERIPHLPVEAPTE